MNCLEARAEFSAYLDEELDPLEHARVEGHLLECSDCLRELDGLKRVTDLYGGLGMVTAPSDFEQRLQEKLKRRTLVSFPHRSRVLRYLPLTLATAAAGLLLIAGFFSYLLLPDRSGFELARNDADRGAGSQTIEQALPDTTSTNSKLSIPLQEGLEAGRRMSEAMADQSASPAPQVDAQESAVKSGGGDATPPVVPAPEAMAPPRATAAQAPPPQPVPVKSAPIPSARDQEIGRESDAAEISAFVPAPAAASDFGQQQEKAVQDDDISSMAKDEAVAVPMPPSFRPPEEARGREERALPMEAKLLSKKQTPSDAVQPAAPAQIEISGHIFTYLDGRWIQQGAGDGEPHVLERSGSAFDALASKHPELREIAKLNGRVLFRLDGILYQLIPATAQ